MKDKLAYSYVNNSYVHTMPDKINSTSLNCTKDGIVQNWVWRSKDHHTYKEDNYVTCVAIKVVSNTTTETSLLHQLDSSENFSGSAKDGNDKYPYGYYQVYFHFTTVF